MTSSPIAAADSLQWRREYAAALLEPDRQALFKRVEVAEALLLSRQETLMYGAGGRSERQEIERPLENLQALKKEVLNFL